MQLFPAIFKKCPALLVCSVFTSLMSFGQDTFYPQNSGVSVTLNAIHFSDFSTGMCVGAEGVIRRTSNSGLNWTSSSSGTIADLNDVAHLNSTTYLVVGDVGTILKTTSFGASWTTPNSGTTSDLTSLFLIGSTVYVTCANGNVLKSTNSGNAWTTYGTNVLLRLNDCWFVSESIGYAVGENGTILKTTNGGVYWNVLNANVGSFSLKSVVFHDMNNGTICGVNTNTNQSVILRTNDAGNNWETSYFSGVAFNNLAFADYTTGMVAGGDLPGTASAIYKTTTQSVSWSEQNTSSNKQLGISYPNPGLAYSCGVNGTILRMTTSVADLPEQVQKISVYPNPFHQFVTIIAAEKEEFSVEITDTQGKLLLQLEHPTTIDLEAFNPGIYFLRYKSATGSSVVRLEKL